MKIGFTIGKFAPFHKGHEFLIRRAMQEMDEFYVVIYDTPQYNITIKTKEYWIKRRFPKVKVLYAYDSPKQYGLDKKSVKIQMQYLANIIKDIPVNYFYSSEEYGKYVAEYLHIQNRIVDKQRVKYPISGSMLRKNKEEHKEFLEKEVYNAIK